MTEMNEFNTEMLNRLIKLFSQHQLSKSKLLVDFQRIHAWDKHQIGLQDFLTYKKIYLNGIEFLTLDHFSKLTEEFYLYYDYGVAIPDFYDPEEFKKLFRPSSELAYPEVTKFNKLDLCK